MQLLSDLPGFLAPGGGSIPYVLVTNLKPGIVIVNEPKREVIIFELTLHGMLMLHVVIAIKRTNMPL